MSLKLVGKLAIPQVCLVLCFGLISFLAINSSFKSMREHYVEAVIEARFQMIDHMIMESAQKSVSESSLFVELPLVLEAYEIALSGDIYDPYSPQSQQARNLLRKELDPILKSYAEKTGKELELHFHLPNGFSLVRVWREYNTKVDGKWVDISDDLRSFRPTVLRTNSSGRISMGLEPGSSGFAIRGVVPIYAPDGRLLGSMEAVQQFDPILETVADQEKTFIALFANDEVLEFSIELQDSEKYPVLGNFVRVFESNNEQIEALITPEFLEKGKTGIVYAKHGHMTFATYPLNDYQGNQVGVIVFAMDTRSVTGLANTTSIMLVLMLTGLAIVATLILLLRVRRLVINPLSRMRAKIQDITEDRADLSEQLSTRQKDEMGDFAKSFNMLTSKLGGILSERENMFDLIHKESDKFESMAHWYGSLLNSIPFPVSVQDADMNWVFINTALEKLLGKTLEEVKGTPCSSWNVCICNTENCAIACAKRGLRQTQFNYEGASYLVDVEVLKDLDGNTTGYIEVIQDMTAFEELTKQQFEAQLASEAKSAFLAHMSHEIRTPLNAIIGMIGIGLKTDDKAQKNYCLERADSASKQLLSIINDVLDMSKIEADKFELSNAGFDLEQMLINATNLISVQAEAKQINFAVDLHADIPGSVEGDELHLSQVVTNLLSNAIKFTPEKGTITLGIEKLAEIGEEVILKVSITDNGIGISKEQQARLFNTFTQADASITRRFGGTGLGLAISKRIIELMGGTIWVESELGEGSKFMFTVKLRRLEEADKPQLSLEGNRQVPRILAVDDSKEIRESFARLMESLKMPYDTAKSGEEALRMIRYPGAKAYDIIILDGEMPDISGLGLAQRIKRINDKNSIIIMGSQADWSAVEKQAETYGVDYFLSKPLFPSPLVNAINICLSGNPSASFKRSMSRSSLEGCDFSGHTVLIAEDVEINREIIKAVLEDSCMEIEFAENGAIAVDLFSEDPEKYSLIMMDVNMPEMDGYEATRTIRALDLEQAKTVPIIAMTANVFKEDTDKCLASGMNDHAGKPLDINVLYNLLTKYLSKAS
ncbi:MAG: response regulator, partial [Eggerthellaceae bacterium]|nr:response regulator [Eggerthellaceae bacterium]